MGHGSGSVIVVVFVRVVRLTNAIVDVVSVVVRAAMTQLSHCPVMVVVAVFVIIVVDCVAVSQLVVVVLVSSGPSSLRGVG